MSAAQLALELVSRPRVIAALYVEGGGVYADLPDVDAWPEHRDARRYPGPYPVVAHPPCARWGRYWHGGPSARVRQQLGADGGCFAAALEAVRTWGGVLEHPEGSHAWRAFGLNLPPRSGGWVAADWRGGWTCCVEQGHYGHAARKATWLYACHVDVDSLTWGRAEGALRYDQGYHSAAERAAAPVRSSAGVRVHWKARASTPRAFRDLLLELARTAYDRR